MAKLSLWRLVAWHANNDDPALPQIDVLIQGTLFPALNKNAADAVADAEVDEAYDALLEPDYARASVQWSLVELKDDSPNA